MSIDFYAELAYISKELSRIKLDLAHADVITLSKGSLTRDISGSIRAYSYIWLAATVERTITDSTKKLIQGLNDLLIPTNTIKSSLFTLLCDPHITSIAARNPSPAWETRLEIFDRLNDTSPATFSVEITSLDGRTIRGEHLERIWKIFGIPGPCLPAPQHKMALKDLADGRNKVAHGNVDPAAFGRTKTPKDIIQLTERIDEILTHFISSLDEYFSRKSYLRASR